MLKELPKPSMLRKYPYEYALIGLFSGLVTLGFVVKSMYSEVLRGKTEQILLEEKVINQNTAVMRELINLENAKGQWRFKGYIPDSILNFGQ